MNRTITFLEHGAVVIEQQTVVAETTVATEVSGPACIYAEVHVRRGRVAFLVDEARVGAPRRFHLFLPRFAVTQPILAACDVVSWGLAFIPPPDLPLPTGAVIVPWQQTSPSRDPAGVAIWARGLRGAASIARRSHPSGLAARVKGMLDEQYGDGVTIGAIAQHIGSPAETLSRLFSQAYGITPVQYRHQLRVIEAMTHLAAGGAPLDVCHRVGFNDLSRFYKVFGRFACGSPGGFGRSKNAKTHP